MPWSCQVTDVDPGNSAAYEDITVSSDFKAVVLDGTLLISYWWDEENKVEYTIYRGVEKEGDYDLFATADEETFYAFTWEDCVEQNGSVCRGGYWKKSMLSPLRRDAHAPRMCMNSITLDTAQTAVYVMTERVNLFNDDENGFRIAVKNAGGQYADFYLVGSYQYIMENSLRETGNVNLLLRIGETGCIRSKRFP